VQLLRTLMDIEGGVVHQRFEDTLRRGALDVFIRLRSDEQQQRAEEILRQHHAYLLTVRARRVAGPRVHGEAILGNVILARINTRLTTNDRLREA
jgi:hypothetical protein